MASAVQLTILLEKRVDNEALKGVKVMIIDDSNTIRRSAEIFLNQAGCEVILAQDGFDALSKITDHEPDVVFRRHHDAATRRLSDLLAHQAHASTAPRLIMLSSKDGLFDARVAAWWIG